MKTLMNAMKVLAIVGLTAGPALAQTAGDKVKESGNDVRREGRKGANRIDESLCTGTKAECAARKAKHRGEEGKDQVNDKATEVKDRVVH